VSEQGRSNRSILAVLVLLVLVTLTLRTWQLNHVPPGIFYDEAGQGLDARDLLHGKFRVFFPRSMGKEPFYVYLATPFVAVWDRTPFAVRVPGALLGTLTVVALYLAARALWRDRPRDALWVGLTSAALWASNYWPQSINRLGFRVNSLPLVLTLALVAWLNWTHRPTRRRAVTFGVLAGLTLTTYLAARITLILWPALYVLMLTREKRRQLAPTLFWALVPMLLIPGPMIVYLAAHPAQAMDRLTSFPLWQGLDHLGNTAHLLGKSVWNTLGGFLGWAGDPIPRHNLPGRPPFGPVLGALFGLGMLLAARATQSASGDERRRGGTLLLWWGGMLLPAILAGEDNPHFLRLLAAVPPAFLLVAWPILWLRDHLSPARRATLPMLLAFFLLLEGAQTTHDYFVTWAQQTDLYSWFQLDMWAIGRTVSQTPGGIGILPLNLYYSETNPQYTLEYVYPDTPILRLRVFENSIEQWLQQHLGNAGGRPVVLVQWTRGFHANSDPKGILAAYLQREGTLVRRQQFRTFEIQTYTLGPSPLFTAAGLHAAVQAKFRQGVTLLSARWGASYLTPSRTQPAVAGAPIWAVLTWKLNRPLPNLKVTLDLVDAAGHRLASDERLLMDSERRPTSEWTPGAVGRSYHILRVPVTLPPGPIYLESRLYNAHTLVPIPPVDATARGSVRWGQEEVTWPRAYPSPAALDIAHRANIPVGGGIYLLGYDDRPRTLAPGQTLTLRLYWHALSASQARRARIELVGTSTWGSVLIPALPAGAVIHTMVDVPLPPELPSGNYSLRLQLPDGKTVSLGTLRVAGRPRHFVPPSVDVRASGDVGHLLDLLGIIDVKHRANELAFILVWRVRHRTSQNLVRFVHLAEPKGKLLTQEDTVPCRGGCPSVSWLPGEVLLDPVHLRLPAGGMTSQERLVVGWYQAATLKRLPAWDVQGHPLPHNVIPLPPEVMR